MNHTINKLPSLKDAVFVQKAVVQGDLSADFTAYLADFTGKQSDPTEKTEEDSDQAVKQALGDPKEKEEETEFVNSEPIGFFQSYFTQSNEQFSQWDYSKQAAEIKQDPIEEASEQQDNQLGEIENPTGKNEQADEFRKTSSNKLIPSISLKGTEAIRAASDNKKLVTYPSSSERGQTEEQIQQNKEKAQSTEQVTVKQLLASKGQAQTKVPIPEKISKGQVSQTADSSAESNQINTKSETSVTQYITKPTDFQPANQLVGSLGFKEEIHSSHLDEEQMAQNSKNKSNRVNALAEAATTPLIKEQEMAVTKLNPAENSAANQKPLIETIETLFFDKAKVLAQGGTVEAKLLLKPETLGEMTIQLSLKEDQLVSVIVVEHEEAKKMLQENLNQLTVSLAAKQIQLGEVSISVMNQTMNDSAFSQTPQQHEAEQQKGHSVKGIKKEKKHTKMEEAEQHYSSRISILA